MNQQAEAKRGARKGHQKNGGSIFSDDRQRGDRHDKRKPLADITGNQQTSQLSACKKGKNSKKNIKELQTANKQVKSEHGRRNSSSGRTADCCSAGKKLSKKQMRRQERASAEDNKITGTEVILYDAPFAQKQREAYFGLCCVCRKEQYSMKSCSRCGQLKYCSHECLRKHCKDEVQKQMCGRVLAFTGARSRLTRDVIATFYASGITEISPYLYSVPRREVYEMLNGPTKAVVLQVLQVTVDLLHLNVIVQDITGQMTVLRIQSIGGVARMGGLNVYTDIFKESLKQGEFLLLVNGHWNSHRDRDSAAIDIVDLLQIMPITDIKKTKQWTISPNV